MIVDNNPISSFGQASGDFLTVGASTATTSLVPTGITFGVTAVPVIQQTTLASLGTPANITISPQAPNGASGTAAQNTPGSLIVSVPAPGATGTAGAEAGLTFQRAGVPLAKLQGLVGVPATYGALYLGNITPSGSNFVFTSNGTSAQMNAPSNTLVLSIANANAVAITTAATILTPPSLAWVVGAAAPSLSQVAGVGTSAVGATLTVQAQNETGTTSTGGALALSSGTGTSTNGNVNMQVGGVTQVAFTPTSLRYTQSSISLTAGGTVTLSAAQQVTPYLVFTGTLPGATTIALNGVVGSYILDFSQVTLGVSGVTITNGAGNFVATTLLGTKTLLNVSCSTTANIAVG